MLHVVLFMDCYLDGSINAWGYVLMQHLLSCIQFVDTGSDTTCSPAMHMCVPVLLAYHGRLAIVVDT